MIEYDEIENRMLLKLVYYGPALSGKTTNLLRLHDIPEKEGRGDLTVLDTKENLNFVGLDIEKIPLVIQFNKRDLKNIIAEDDINRTWEQTGIPVLMSSAIMGWGVIETFGELVKLAYDHVDGKHRRGKESRQNS